MPAQLIGLEWNVLEQQQFHFEVPDLVGCFEMCRIVSGGHGQYSGSCWVLGWWLSDNKVTNRSSQFEVKSYDINVFIYGIQ